MTDAPARLATALSERYRIERELGQGGMATVYLAFDLKHDRKVALKVLKPELAALLGAERFVVEIKTTANLQHPHILPLFDSGSADGFLFYVMPFIDGETLRGKLNRETQLGIEESVKLTREVADALDYAHRHGVIHRDIKPENILVQDGRALVADFGIALALSAAAGGRMTETGLSLGTPHYMSPEQATAEKELTPRSDIYSLGSVLYEMLTGSPPHVGASAQQIIVKIVTDTARPVTELRKSVPPNVAAAVAKSLEKLAADRFESAKAFADALGNPGYIGSGTTATTAMMPAGRSKGIPRPLFAGISALAALFLALFLWVWLRPTPPGEVRRLSLALPEDQTLGSPAEFRLAISPDGSRMVYMGSTAGARQSGSLWLRSWSELNATVLPGTDGGFNPSFSPDGGRIAFVAGTPRAVRTMSLAGGPPITLTDSLVDRGGLAWGNDGYIYFDAHLEGDGIARVRETGGSPERVTMPDSTAGELYHVVPAPLPNGKGMLFTVVRRASPPETDVAVVDLRTRKHRVLVHGVMGRYAASGHLLYVTSDGTLMAAPFDQDRLELMGEGVAVAEGLSVRGTSRVDLAVSANGVIVYTTGSRLLGLRELVWVTRDGAAVPVDPEWTGLFGRPRLSPDGKQLAVHLFDPPLDNIWVKQLDRGPASKLTSEGGRGPSWSPDGKTIGFSSPSGGIWTAPADGSVLPTRVYGEQRLSEPEYALAGDWIVFRVASNLFAVRTSGDTSRRELVVGTATNLSPTVSPNGRWLAYASDESGRFEIYVRPFPDTRTAKRQVSSAGGAEPHWSRDGRELFYISARNELVAVPVGPGLVFSAGVPKVLYSVEQYVGPNSGRVEYDVSPDGTRFVMTRSVVANRSNTDELILVENFFQELKTKVKK